MISVFGSTGYIGSTFMKMYGDECIGIPRDSLEPKTNKILYFISTTDNYNIYSNVTVDVNTNLVHLCKVLEQCKNIKNLEFYFISSWFVYGDVDILPAKESYVKKPKGLYSISKSCAEDVLINFCNVFGIKYKIFRLSNVYGNIDSGTSSKKNALHHIVSQIKQDKEIKLSYSGQYIRDYLYVTDVCRCIYYMINNSPENEIYNIGSGYAHKFIDLVDYVYYQLKKNKKIKSYEPSKEEKFLNVKDMVLDVSKLYLYGYDIQNNVKIYDGIKELCKI